jgi:hypothetical protein
MVRHHTHAAVSAERVEHILELLCEKIASKVGGHHQSTDQPNGFRQALQRAVSKFDVDGSGMLEKGEFASAISMILPGVQAHEIDALVKVADKDGSGVMSVDEIVDNALMPLLSRVEITGGAPKGPSTSRARALTEHLATPNADSRRRGIGNIGHGGARKSIAQAERADSALLRACIAGDAAAVRAAIERDGASIATARDATGFGCLHLASAHGHCDVVELLVSLPLDVVGETPYVKFVDCRDASGNTALHHAAKNGHLRCITRLRAAGADGQLLNRRGESVALQAAARGHAADGRSYARYKVLRYLVVRETVTHSR